MATHNLFIDIDRGESVLSAVDSSLAPLPAIVQGDTLAFNIYLLTGFSRVAAYAPVPTAGLTLEVAVGLKEGDLTLYYAQQFSWAADGEKFTGSISLNTAAVTTLIGAKTQAQAFFEVKVIEAGAPATVLQKSVMMQAAVIKEGGLEEPAVPTPLSAEVASAIYLQRVVTATEANPIILQNGSVTLSLYVDTDGSFKTVRLT